MVRLWCEWDLGQDDYVFSSQEKAIRWLDAALAQDEDLREEFANAQQIIDEGLAGFRPVTLI